MHVGPHRTADELAEFIRAESRARVARRLTPVRLALLGQTAARVAGQVPLSERQVRTWVARYNGGGADASADRPGRGRKKASAEGQEQHLRDRLRAGPTEADGVCTPRGEDVRRIPEREFGAARSLPAVYALLRRLGSEPLRPRPRHPRADPAAADRFEKVSPAASPGSPRPAPPGGPRCGSRTRPGSAGRGR